LPQEPSPVISRHSSTNLPALTKGIILSSLAPCLLRYVCELGVELCNPLSGKFNI